MSDEPEELGELEVESDACPDWFEVENGYVIAPRGWGDVQDHFGCPLIRIRMKSPGGVDVLTSEDDGVTWKWRDVEKLKVPADVIAIKGGKP